MRKPDWNVHLVETVDEAQAFLRWLGERRPVLAYDTETSGLEPYGKDVLRMCQFGDAKNGWALDYRNWRGVIEIALRDYTGMIAGHNLPFDLAFTEQAGLPIPPVHRRHDTMVMSHILNPARSHGLKQRGDGLIPGASAAQGALSEGMSANRWTWGTVPTDFAPYWRYAASDTCLTAVLVEDSLPQLEAKGYMEAYLREMAVQDIAYRMQKRGLLIDVDYTTNLLSEWLTEMAEVEEDLHALGVANPSAGQQVAQALQLTENWEPDAWTETGLPKVDEKVLSGIDSAIARKVLRYRRLRKWTKAYLSRFLEGRDAHDRVHPDLKPLRARTGRWSITGPPLQTLPRGHEIRDCILPNEGKQLHAIDYDTMEMRMFAHFSKEPGIIAAIEAGEDLHTFVAREVYADPTIQKNDPRRQLAKNTQFCKIYGGGAQKIADTAGVSLGEAKTFEAQYMARFPGVKDFMDTIDRVGRTRLANEGAGYIVTVGGRYTPCADTKIYALLNYLIQGSCADLFKMKLIDLDAAGFGDTMMLPVHDEVLFSFDASTAEDDTRQALEIMEDYESFAVPFTCEASGGYDRWGAKYR